MVKTIIAFMLVLIGTLAYRLCVPVMFLLVACKLWYEPYTWNWLDTIIVPLVCGACGFIAVLIAHDMVD